MRTKPFLCLFLTGIALLSVGCKATPAPMNVYTVDAIVGKSLPEVRVDHWDNKTPKAGGFTDSLGRLDGIKVMRGDRLNLSKPGYEPVRIEIGFRGASVVPVTRDPQQPGASSGTEVNDPDAETLPFSADHTVTVLLRPKF